MFVVLVSFRVKPEFADAFRALVLTQAKNSLDQESDCRRFDVCFSPKDPTSCLLYELYESRAAFDAHLETQHFKEFDGAIADGVVSKEVTFWCLTREPLQHEPG